MPHPGTHIAVVQYLANSTDPADHAIASLFGLGHVDQDPVNSDAVGRNRYACLGAIGPDIFYFLLDNSPAHELLQEVAIRYYARLHELSRISALGEHLTERIENSVEAIPCLGQVVSVASLGFHTVMQELKLGIGIIGNLLASGVVHATGFNALSLLGCPRQEGKPREQWFWADYLHYVRSGEFAQRLLDLALLDSRYKNTPALAAYAAGYFTHYVADAIGHPYVNQIVGGPYRLHRQRHTLVENFMDSVLWNRAFLSGPRNGDDDNPYTGEPWLDRLQGTAGAGSKAAAWHRSRAHLLFEVAGPLGASGLDDALDDLLESVADAIATGANTVFSIKDVDVAPEATFELWQDMMIQAIRDVYGDQPGNPRRHPMGLGGDGIPTAENLNTAYVTCYALLKASTDSSVEEPEFPDTAGMEQALQEFLDSLKDKLGAALGAITNIPMSSLGSLDPKSFWEALKDWVEKVIDAAGKIIEAVVDIIDDACALVGEVSRFMLLMSTYFGRRALWMAYAAIHKLLELRAYAQPFPENALGRPSLWKSPGNPGRMSYPAMEIVEDGEIAQDELWSGLDPSEHPASAAPGVEAPWLMDVGSRHLGPGDPLEQLLWGVGTHDMFQGAVPAGPDDLPMDDVNLDYGGIITNCKIALRKLLAHAAQPGATTCVPLGMAIPNYNLDGDRGGGWVSWDITGGALRQPPVQVAAWTD